MMPDILLPDISSEDGYRAVYPDNTIWLPAIHAICERHNLSRHDLHRPVLGSHVVYQSGQAIVKLFCPVWSEDERSERLALQRVRGLPVPELIADGVIEGWPYLVMTVVPGIPALDVWPDLDNGQRLNIVRELGEIMRRLHDHAAVPELAVDWEAFIRERIAGCPGHHAVDKSWGPWIEERLGGFSEPPFVPALINADLTEDHVLLAERDGRWAISGLIDFGDAMMGHPHYDFIAPFSFYTFGQPFLSRALVEAYGMELKSELEERMTTYCLLHKYGRLADFLDRFAAKDGDDFCRALWGATSR